MNLVLSFAWIFSLFIFLGIPLLVLFKAESIYNVIFKFWKKFIDDDTKIMIEENKDKFIIFIKIVGGFYLFLMGLRVGFAFV